MTSEQHRKLDLVLANLDRLGAIEQYNLTADDDLTATFRVASEDVFTLLKRQIESENATDRRGFVRSVFAFVESILFALKQEILRGGQKFTRQEFAMLQEEAYELTENGEARIKTAKITVKSNLKFTFKAWSKATGTKCMLDLSDEGWRNFQAAIRVRDRLMHPKRPKDLDVSDDEVKCAISAYFWFYKTFALSTSQVVIARIRHLQKIGKWDAPLTEPSMKLADALSELLTMARGLPEPLHDEETIISNWPAAVKTHFLTIVFELHAARNASELRRCSEILKANEGSYRPEGLIKLLLRHVVDRSDPGV